MVWRKPRTAPSGEASALAKILTSRSGDLRVGQAEPDAFERFDHRGKIDGVAHHGVTDHERA